MGPANVFGSPFEAARSSRRHVLLGAGSVVVASSVLSIAATSKSVGTRQEIGALAAQQARLAAFEEAVGEMQERSRKDPKDPKGWRVNADAHKAFCSLRENAADQIHYCWWFLPWHRAYLSVTERKLREIAHDDTLSLPYWNWSVQRTIPAAYARSGSPLAEAVRFTSQRPLEDLEVDYFPNDPVRQKLGVAALGAKIFEAASKAQIGQSFGGIARPNPHGTYGNNRLEGVPHGPVHNYVGGESGSGQIGDMTDFATAGRDPIFFAHHANLDRLWENWRSVPGHKKLEPSSEDFLNHEFAFTWLDGTTVMVKVADTLDISKLGYAYDDVSVFGNIVVAEAQSATNRLPPVATQQLNMPFKAEAAGPAPRVILEISGVDPPKGPITVGVFIHGDDASSGLPGESVGAFSAVKAGGTVAWPSDTLTFDITDVSSRLAGQKVHVELIPFRIQAAATESYPPLRFKQMRIISEQP